MSIYLGDRLIQLGGSGAFDGLEKVYHKEGWFTISETHTTTSYEYPENNAQTDGFRWVEITDETTGLLNSDNILIWSFAINHRTENKHYEAMLISKKSVRTGNICINDVEGSITNSNQIYPEYRNSYGTLFRLIANRQGVTLYQGDYDVDINVYKL